ncbi:hypothetical protein YC2023_075087 [Brassica napus]
MRIHILRDVILDFLSQSSPDNVDFSQSNFKNESIINIQKILNLHVWTPRIGDEQFGEYMKEVVRKHGIKYERFVYKMISFLESPSMTRFYSHTSIWILQLLQQSLQRKGRAVFIHFCFVLS